MTAERLSEDHVELECESTLIDTWTSYSAGSDLFTPADQCRLSIGLGTSDARDIRQSIAKAQALLKSGKEVKLWVNAGGKRALQGVYVVDGHEIDNDADSGTTFSVNLRDRAAYLIQSAADPKLYERGDTLISVARRAVKPWPQLQVTADHVAARDLRQARVSKDKLRKLQDKAKSWGIPPRMMSEKIAASIDHGTITFEDFAGAQAGGLDSAQFGPGEPFSGSVSPLESKPLTSSASYLAALKSGKIPGGPPLRNQTFTSIPWSGATGLSSLQIYSLRVKDIRPQSGETVWEYLDRHARRNGLLMSVTPDGKLLFCGLQYDQQPSYTITRRIEGDRTQNNVISGGYRLDISDVASEVIVYGRVKGNDATRSAFKGRAVAADGDVARVPYVKTLMLHDNSIKSAADAQQRAQYELGKSKQGAQVLEYTVRGHSQNGVVWAPDSICSVEDHVAGISGAWYVTARTFVRSSRQGPLTQLKLVPKYAIALAREAA